MSKTGPIRDRFNDLEFYAWPGQAAGFGIFIVGCVLIAWKPAGISPILAYTVMVVGAVWIYVMVKRQLRLLWIYRNSSPVSMKMKLDKAGSAKAQCYACLARGHEIRYKWKVPLYSSACLKKLNTNDTYSVQVYIDPKDNTPAVIRTSEGLLWGKDRTIIF